VGPVPIRPGVTLLRAQAEPSVVAPGEVFRVRYEWRCDQAITDRRALQVEFINAAWLLAQKNPFAEPPEEAPLGFGTERPWMYELAPLAANPPGTHYEQIAHYAAGRGLTPGPYVVRVAVNPPGQNTRLVPVARLDLKGPSRD
jgi:hypothetical protein